MAQPFDCRTAATVIMHSVLVGINLRVHEYLKHHPPYSFAEMFSDLKQFIMRQACPDGRPYGARPREDDLGLPSLDMPILAAMPQGED
jgi:hypothetical protein